MLKKKLFLMIFLLTVIIVAVIGFWFFNISLFKNQEDNFLNVSGVVIPHHNIVADVRAKFFMDLALKIKKPKTIILVSPNHFDAGASDIQTTNQDWRLGQGQISHDENVISYLAKNNFATNEPASFLQEHGIYNILSDIHKNFPGSKLVPIILKQNYKLKLANLEKGLLQSCQDCLMISSVDFSHYQPALLANLHDDKSIRDLENLDYKNLLENAEVDSPQALALLALWAKDHNTLRFNLQNHTNSDVIYQKLDGEGTTHVFGYYQTGPKILPKKEVSFTIAGDTMFTRGVSYKFGSDFNKAFANFGDRVFWGADAKILNFEGIITKEPFISTARTMIFKFLPIVTKTLNFLHINAISLANNHSDNAGAEGISTTKSLMAQNNIQTFGGAGSLGIGSVAEFKGQVINLVLIGINLTYPEQIPDPVVDIIKKYKAEPNTKIIVMPHWGQEYSKAHNNFQQNSAHLWIDAGADLVIGSHPHVIQDSELYKNKPIFYSLGNFLFDQTFSQATEQGLIVAGKFTENGLEIFALPTKSINIKPQLSLGSQKKLILDSLYKPFKDYLVSTPFGSLIKIPN